MQTVFSNLRQQRFEDPPITKFLLGSPIMGFVWFFARLYLGWQWLDAGWHKVFGDSSIGWVTDGMVNGKLVHAGDSILGYWQRAVAIPPTGRPLITFDWYRDVLGFMIDQQWHTWFTYLISYGEVLVGVALILGAFTGIAAFFGAVMNINFMLAGTASTNPVLFAVAVLMILAWKNAGYLGLDRWILLELGTPWQPGRLFHHPKQAVERAAAGTVVPRGAGG
jgi:thiosulfate dehydrogenase [quinone] large subunit